MGLTYIYYIMIKRRKTRIMKIRTRYKGLLLKSSFTLCLFFSIFSCANDLTNKEQTEGRDIKKEFNSKSFTGISSSQKEYTPHKTKTAGRYKLLKNSNNGIRFYWDVNDYNNLWVNIGGTYKWQRFNKQDTLVKDSDKITSARFYLYKGIQLTEERYPIWYSHYGINNETRQTYIPTNLAQEKAGDFTDLASKGDCGFATAEDNGIWYSFTLQHAISYLTFMPYAGEGKSKEALKKCKLTKITFTSDEYSHGHFYFDDNGILDESKRPIGQRQTRYLTCGDGHQDNGFKMASNQEEAKSLGALMVMAPGTYHNIEVTYTLYDPIVGTTGVFKKKIAEITLRPGKNKVMYSQLVADDVSHLFGKYHMWGASQFYWQGHESNAHHKWRKGGVAGLAGFPTSGDPRYYSNYYSPGASNTAPVGSIASTVPSANFLSWYVKLGDPRWDDSPFTYDGHLFTGRMWFRRRQYFGLTDAQMNERNAQGDDCRIRQDASVGNNATSWEDVPESNRSKYFCIMALGYYDSGGQLHMGDAYEGRYWTSTCVTNRPGEGPYWAYYLLIRRNLVGVYGGLRNTEAVKLYGYQLWPGEN